MTWFWKSNISSRYQMGKDRNSKMLSRNHRQQTWKKCVHWVIKIKKFWKSNSRVIWEIKHNKFWKPSVIWKIKCDKFWKSKIHLRYQMWQTLEIKMTIKTKRIFPRNHLQDINIKEINQTVNFICATPYLCC